jgi:hypothetical protein
MRAGHQTRGFYMQRNQPATTQDLRGEVGREREVDWKGGKEDEM